jgi:hypothetical protein
VLSRTLQTPDRILRAYSRPGRIGEVVQELSASLNIMPPREVATRTEAQPPEEWEAALESAMWKEFRLNTILPREVAVETKARPSDE